ncbi:MAG: porin family protein [Ginsengibacter sp.]
MKKILAIVCSTILFTTAKSQIYIQAGVNLSNITTSQPSQTQRNSSLTTFEAGILDRCKLDGSLFFETGLLFEGKGSKARINLSEEDAYTSSFNPFYIEVPANLVYRFSFPKRNKLFIDAGPYIAMGIVGQTKSTGNIGGVNIKNTTAINFSSANANNDDVAYSDLNRFDYGINVGAGLDFRTIFFKVNYGFGLSQLNVNQIDAASNDKNRYQTATISLGVPIRSF